MFFLQKSEFHPMFMDARKYFLSNARNIKFFLNQFTKVISCDLISTSFSHGTIINTILLCAVIISHINNCEKKKKGETILLVLKIYLLNTLGPWVLNKHYQSLKLKNECYWSFHCLCVSLLIYVFNETMTWHVLTNMVIK